MKKLLIIAFLGVSVVSHAQTLQDVTSSGNSTTENVFVAGLVERYGFWDAAKTAAYTISGGSTNGAGPGGRTYYDLWTANAASQYITFDIGASFQVSSFSFGTFWSSDFHYIPNAYTISYSDDNINYTTVISVTGNTNTAPLHVAPGTGRYWRLTVDALQSGQTVSLITGVQIMVQGVGAALMDKNPWGVKYNTSDISFTSGKVGIGTTSPSSYGHGGTNRALEIHNPNTAVNSQSHLLLTSSTTAAGSAIGTVTWLASSAPFSSAGWIAGVTENDNEHLSIHIGTNATNRFTVRSDGNVGIGTNPSSKLEVAGTIRSSSTETYGFGSSDNVSLRAASSANALGIYTSNTERIRVAANGNIGIGTDIPDQKLTVKGGGIGFDGNSADKKLYSPIDGVLEWMTSDYAAERAFAVSSQGVKKVYLSTLGTSYLNGGNVLIGKTSQTNSTYKLDVDGIVRANKVVVNTTGADFVFDSTYKLPSLETVADFIKANKHLPQIASAEEMQKNGLDVGEQQTKLLQKIEELTLYMIETNRKLAEQQKTIESLTTELKKVKSRRK